MDLGRAISNARRTARHALDSRLEDVLGSEHAETLMTFLPAHTGADVATGGDIDLLKADFGRLRSDLDLRLDRMDARFDKRTTSSGSTSALCISTRRGHDRSDRHLLDHRLGGGPGPRLKTTRNMGVVR